MAIGRMAKRVFVGITVITALAAALKYGVPKFIKHQQAKTKATIMTLAKDGVPNPEYWAVSAKKYRLNPRNPKHRRIIRRVIYKISKDTRIPPDRVAETISRITGDVESHIWTTQNLLDTYKREYTTATEARKKTLAEEIKRLERILEIDEKIQELSYQDRKSVEEYIGRE